MHVELAAVAVGMAYMACLTEMSLGAMLLCIELPSGPCDVMVEMAVMEMAMEMSMEMVRRVKYGSVLG